MMRLDHVGFVGNDVDTLRAAFVALGFAPTEPEWLMRREADGRTVPLDQRSCHTVFHDGYIELSATERAPVDHHLAQYAHEGAALTIIAIAVEDAEAAHLGCTSRGVPVSPIAQASRAITYGERHGEAQFTWFMVEPSHAPEGLVCFVEHRTLELVHQPEVELHPNRVAALREVFVVPQDLEEAVERYGAIFGHRPDRIAGEYCFRLGSSAVRLVTPARLSEVTGKRVRAGSKGLLGLTVECEDLAVARRVLRAGKVTPSTHGDALIVPPTRACGATLRFVQAVPATTP